MRKIQIYNPHKSLEFNEAQVLEVFHFLEDNGVVKNVAPGELSIAFLTHDEHCQLHADFLDDPTPTDVITFPADPNENLAGEICVSIDTAHSYAAKHGIPFSNELTLYLVHGFLHLASFDDLNEDDRKEMKRQEQICMSTLVTNEKIPFFKYSPK